MSLSELEKRVIRLEALLEAKEELVTLLKEMLKEAKEKPTYYPVGGQTNQLWDTYYKRSFLPDSTRVSFVGTCENAKDSGDTIIDTNATSYWNG